MTKKLESPALETVQMHEEYGNYNPCIAS